MNKFHVTNEKSGSKKFLQVADKSELRSAIQSRFSVDQFILQYEFADAHLGTEWVDVENDADIPDSVCD